MATQTITLTVRNGTTQHGDPHLLCSPPAWTDILVFFLGNYVAHAATVVTYPGESLVSTVGAILFALVFPTSGVVRGLSAIARHAVFFANPLDQAARAGALCMVVRTKEWKPLHDQFIEDAIWRGGMVRKVGKKYHLGSWWYKRPDEVTFSDERVSDAESLDFRFYWPPWMWESNPFWQFLDTLGGFVAKGKKVHGFYVLTPGYALAHVPRDAVVLPSTSPNSVDKTCTISTNYSIAKALVAIIQLCFACISLGRSAGTEIATNGYGSYNLTVVQYALMSLLNLIGIAVNPTYPTLFLVHSQVMDEAVQRGSQFDGVIGKLMPERAEILGVDSHKISGKFHLRHSKTETSDSLMAEDVLPLIKSHRRGNWIESSMIINASRPTYLFQPDFVSDTELFCQIGTRLRALQQPVATQIFAHHSTAARFEANQLQYPLALASEHDERDERNLYMADNPSLFVPCCPSFQRKGHSSYAVHYDRIFPNQMGMIHFVGQNATRRSLVGALLTQYGSLLIAASTIAIIGGFTRFRKGEGSTVVSRAIFMTWLAVGLFMGSGIHNVVRRWGFSPIWRAAILLGLPLWFLPAALGFYQVVVVLTAYGICIRL